MTDPTEGAVLSETGAHDIATTTAAAGTTSPGAGADRRPVIEIDHVTKDFGDFVAVNDAHFTIREGEFFSMLGPSGCGKTTTLRMIAGFEQPTSGAIRLEGVDVSKVPPYRRNVNTVFQQYALFPHMTVRDNVAFGPRSKKIDKAETARRVDELLEIVRLSEFAHRKPAQLSGGQQQRVALARALVNYPSALLLDEPLGALDLKLRQVMQFELKRIQREVGITFIYVTHDQEEALTMSDRIAVMSAGNVEQIGTPTEIYDHPDTVFVAGFIGQANLWPATVDRIGDGSAHVSCLGAQVIATPHRDSRAGQDAMVMVRPERISISVVEPDAAESKVEAVVADLTFQGPMVRLSLSAAGSSIVAHIGADTDLPLLRPGDRVWAAWSPGAALLLPPSDIPTTDEEVLEEG